MGGFKDLKGYQMAYALAMKIFHSSQTFPIEERFALQSQIRRSARSVAANMAEAYRKRQYPAFFQNKLSDCDAENSESQVWIDFARDCGYWSLELASEFELQSLELGKMIKYMMDNPEKFGSSKLWIETLQ